MPRLKNLLRCELLLLALGAVVAISQPLRREITPFPVSASGNLIPQPFAGGINTPNHEFVDIDSDGDLDMFIFDNDLFVDFHRNDGTKYSPNFHLEPNVIQLPGFLSWYLFVDYNGDGSVDLATDDSLSGVKLYRNDGSPSFPIFVQDGGVLLDDSSRPVFSGYFSIPSFVDLNGDSVLDFLSSNSADGSINYYVNVGTRQSPLFHFVTGMFSGITVIGDSCYTTSAQTRNAKSAHGAGGMRFADIDADGAPDLFYGDFFAGGLFYMRNVGTAQTPLLECTSNRFPPGGSLLTAGFNHPNLEDIDGDGDLDLFVGVLNNMQRNGFWFYENTGTAFAPSYGLRTKNYLSSLDVGLNAHPALVDIDGDSKRDLIVGNACDGSCVSGQLWYFRNTGTATSPEFTLIDSAFGGVSGNFSYAPVFADFDNDTDPDLVLGRGDGRVILYRNDGTLFAPVDTILSGQTAVPTVGDLDADGDVDMLVGKFNGQLAYYRNDGTPNAFSFTLVSPAYEGIAVGHNAKPTLVFDQQRRLYDLLIGNSAGRISLYANMGDSASPVFVLQPPIANIDSMREAAIAAGDIDSDGDNDYFVGTSKGGIHFYRNDKFTTVDTPEEKPKVFALHQNYPNPFNPATTISFSVQKLMNIRILVYDVFGREVGRLLEARVAPGSYQIPWNAAGFSSGVYFCRMEGDNSYIVRNMILTK